jgi:PKD repeat protein
MRIALVLMLVIAGCGDDGGGRDASAPFDLGIPDVGLGGDMPGQLRGAFTIIGCGRLDAPSGEPRCLGQAPLTLKFVPLGSGVDTFVWTFNGGMPASSKVTAPTVAWTAPGTYGVTLAAGGAAGQTTSSGTVIVTSGATGSPCLGDVDCDATSGLSCVCKPGDTGCVGGLAVGFCTRGCSGGGCGAGEICADFTRGGAYVPGGNDDGGASGDVWRRALCVPSCTQPSDCRAGFDCRELPTLKPGASAGGAYGWQRGCFADVGGDDGDSCDSAAGDPQPWACLSGRCDRMGARGLCTSGCATTSDCPSTAACASYNGSPQTGACLVRCDTMHLCTSDPLLDCELANQVGGLGFSISPSEPGATRYCAPLRCSLASQCAPSGSCTAMGGASFCMPN